MKMVQGRVWLFDGGTIRIQATDMLSALKMATAAYDGKIKRMTMKTVEEGEEDGWCGMGEDHHGHVRQPEDQASSAASGW
jgi:hypothetical protein